MPYITEDRRDALDTRPDDFHAQVAGELNYQFTQLIITYMLEHGLNYRNGNDVLGALDACAREFYDRVMRPYEDKKIRENGDVYPPELLSKCDKHAYKIADEDCTCEFPPIRHPLGL